MYIISYFVVFSVLGWIIEVIYRSISNGRMVNPGFLAGPYLLIHGLGALFVLGAHTLLPSLTLLPLRMALYLVGLTAIELISGVALKKIFHIRLWDYSDNRFQLGGHVCLLFSVYWMLLASALDLSLDLLLPMAASLHTWAWPMAEIISIAIGAAMTMDLFFSVRRWLTKRVDKIEDSESLRREFVDLAVSVLEMPQVLKLHDCKHHLDKSRLDHVLEVAWLAFRACRGLSLDCRAVVRGALLHDLFYYDWRREGPNWHGFRHPGIALKNALELTTLSHKEQDIIRKHMWPLTVVPPRYAESLVVCFSDQYCSLRDYLVPMPLALFMPGRYQAWSRNDASSFPHYAVMQEYLSSNKENAVQGVALDEGVALNILLIDAQPRAMPFTFFKTLTLPRVAGATPGKHNVRILDGRTESIKVPTIGVDLIGITFSCNNARLAYSVADRAKELGIPVVAGGVHTTAVPDEALEHFDSVLLGEAEGGAWETLLRDVERGALQQRYRNATPPDLNALQPPRLDLLKSRLYLPVYPVEASRGCPNRCSFCFSKTIHETHRKRPVEQVVADVRRCDGNTVFFMDDNFCVDPEYATELFLALRPLKKRLYFQTQLSVANDEDLVRLAVEAGCRGVFVGLESINAHSLHGVDKDFNCVEKYKKQIDVLDRNGVFVVAGLLFGLDGDSADVFQSTSDFLETSPLCSVAVNLPIPYPGTDWHAVLKKEGRVLNEDYEEYTGYRPIVCPKGMTLEELDCGYNEFVNKYFSTRSVLRRFRRQKRSFSQIPKYAAVNLAFRLPRQTGSRRI